MKLVIDLPKEYVGMLGYSNENIEVILNAVRNGRVLKEEKWLTGGKCSGCGGDAPYWCLSTGYYKSAYCPSCGAKMEEDIDADCN